MTQTVIWNGKAGILLRNTIETEESGSSEGLMIFMEILFPAGAVLPEAGSSVLILPQSREGIVLQCRITDSNSDFCRVMAAVRLEGSSQMTPE